MVIINVASTSKPDHQRGQLRPYMCVANTQWEPTTIVIWRDGGDWLQRLEPLHRGRLPRSSLWAISGKKAKWAGRVEVRKGAGISTCW
jgi:hypothetical protein